MKHQRKARARTMTSLDAALATTPMDNGQQAFASGVCRAGEQIAPGLGLFIHQCVQRVLAVAQQAPAPKKEQA